VTFTTLWGRESQPLSLGVEEDRSMTRVALVVLDTLRKDAFNRCFGWLPGRRFEHAWSTAKWTMPAHASLFTGKYASEVGVNARSEGFDCPEPALAEVLTDAGYTSRAFSANLMVSPVFGFGRGFDSFEGTWRVNVNSKGLSGWRELVESRRYGSRTYTTLLRRTIEGQYRVIPSIVAGLRGRFSTGSVPRSLGWTEGDDGAATLLDLLRKGRYTDTDFLFVNLMEAHAPYSPPAAFRTGEDASYDEVAATLTDDEPDGRTVREAYDGSVRYLADRYRRIFAELERRFDYVITLSDHGELFGEHGSWRHLHGVYPELTHVPLVISGRGLSGTCSKTVNLLDVHRTVLDVMDERGESRGQTLLGEVENRLRLVEYEGLRSARLEMMHDAGYSDRLVESYDRPLTGLAGAGGYYGYETLDGWEENEASTVDQPRARLRDLKTSIPDRAGTHRTSVETSEAVRARLDDLGYV
jgi:arylsulfatase A-like enzyme